MSRLDPDDGEYLQEQANALVRGGYNSLEEIEQSLREIVEDSTGKLSERDLHIEVRNAMVRAVTRLQAEQESWAPLTDYDRLRTAFDQLEEEGIVARENFTCCGTCGAAEIGTEIEDFEAQTGRPASGYVFFHQQDTDRATEGGGLYFNYGTALRDGTEADSLAVGQRLFDVLGSVGLMPQWDGSLGQRVGLGLNWQRRWIGPTPKPIKRWFF